ncbi:MAG TPA: hypothetical protein VMU80_15510 [Bryobacteraceae bacterium]|nr:hypothetical protein [Bryobacteraceae bacterium]
MRATDTDVLVRLITRDDPCRAASAVAFVENGAWVSVLAPAEASWTLTSVDEVTTPAHAWDRVWSLADIP